MLMDEPFGAIDPINRDRLQDEFLRLQALVRKTIVFVTHDIDEAIKMGDRIAILREGGHLAQYGTPADILSSPADDFVARFVGADRGLKRLSLTTLGELELPKPNGHSPTLRLPDTMTARDALSALLTDGGAGALVVEQDGSIRGIATIDALGGLLKNAKTPETAVSAPAQAPADEDDA
jgi:osmoprotectant transport system ATP-binding protein